MLTDAQVNAPSSSACASGGRSPKSLREPRPRPMRNRKRARPTVAKKPTSLDASRATHHRRSKSLLPTTLLVSAAGFAQHHHHQSSPTSDSPTGPISGHADRAQPRFPLRMSTTSLPTLRACVIRRPLRRRLQPHQRGDEIHDQRDPSANPQPTAPGDPLIVSRRWLLFKGAVALNGVVGLVLAVPVLRYLLAPWRKDASFNSWISLGSLDSFPTGETRLAYYKNPSQNPWDRRKRTTRLLRAARSRQPVQSLRHQLRPPRPPGALVRAIATLPLPMPRRRILR